MKKQGKVLLTLLCAALLVAGSAMGTLAYLTDDDADTNTFTVGKVELGNGELQEGLDEAKVNEYGEKIDKNGDKIIDEKDRVQENTYKLVPGYTYVKDPTVHVKNTSEDSYVFVKVENGLIRTVDGAQINIEAETDDSYVNVVDQITKSAQDGGNGWQKLTGVSGVDNVYWKKWEKPADTTGTTDLLVFSEFKIDGDTVVDVDIAGYQDAEIVVTAYAIQAAGFDTAAFAWEALASQLGL